MVMTRTNEACAAQLATTNANLIRVLSMQSIVSTLIALETVTTDDKNSNHLA